MAIRLNIPKAIQAASVLLKTDRCKRMSYLRLIKLLYIADRESLKETGRKITRDRTVAMKNGPVLSGIYDLIKGRHEAADEWSQKIRKDGYQVELVDDPGSGQLSRYEIKKLREV